MNCCTRRDAISFLAGVSVLAATGNGATADPQRFIAAAFKMKAEAERTGDQPYGAVVVRQDEIVGWGPSRVVSNRDITAHAEREAIRDAQRRLGRSNLSGCVLYSTSRPCAQCEHAAAEAKIERMIFGDRATDAGPPRL
jgi:tRNA(adenine34) deaminase